MYSEFWNDHNGYAEYEPGRYRQKAVLGMGLPAGERELDTHLLAGAEDLKHRDGHENIITLYYENVLFCPASNVSFLFLNGRASTFI